MGVGSSRDNNDAVDMAYSEDIAKICGGTSCRNGNDQKQKKQINNMLTKDTHPPREGGRRKGKGKRKEGGDGGKRRREEMDKRRRLHQTQQQVNKVTKKNKNPGYRGIDGVTDGEKRVELEQLYKSAQDLLQPPMSSEKFRSLVDIKKRVGHLISSPGSESRPSTSKEYVSYPSIQDPRLNGVVSAKKEFALGAYPPVDTRLGVQGLWHDKCSSNRFLLTPNQQALKNFVSPSTPYNGLLLFHGVGTGKTCAAVTISEQFPDKKVLVLVQPGLKNNFRENIFDFSKLRLTETGLVDMVSASEQCTGMRYLNDIPDADFSNKQEVVKRIDRMIRSKYTFRGTQVFAKEVNTLMENHPKDWEEQIRQRYSDHVIIVDEAHHLRINFNDEERKAVTPAIRNVLRFSEGTKLLLLTATPMFNDVTDLIELLNLMLINDKRKTVRYNELFDKTGNLTAEGETNLVESTRGYVSYLRGDDPFSFPLRLNPSDTDDSNALRPDSSSQPTLNIKGDALTQEERFRRTVLTVSDMSPYQRQAYGFMDQLLRESELAKEGNDYDMFDEDAYENIDSHSSDEGSIDKKKNAPSEKTSSNVVTTNNKNSAANTFVFGMGISNIVYPLHTSKRENKTDIISDEVSVKLSHGRIGFNNCFQQVTGRGLRVRYTDPSRQFLSGPGLGIYAPKIKTIIDRVLKSEGIVFVYSKFLDSGIIPLAIALEHAGLNRYGQSNILNDEASRSKNDKGWTYIALTARKADLSMNKDDEIQAARSVENVNGDKVKVILGSENASEGLDFRNIREVHILDPWYHFNKTEQIVGRAARNCSHRDLPVEKRNVTVYLHAARIKGSPRETIDIRAYRIAEQKQRRIQRVENLLVANSFDCNLNKNAQFYDPNEMNLRLDVQTSQGNVIRNYAVGDRYPRQRITCIPDLNAYSSSPSSDGKRNTKKSISPQIDDTTYDAIKHTGGVHSCKAVVVSMFRRNHVYDIHDIKTECRRVYPYITNDAIMMAVQELLEDHMPVKNPQGEDGYVIYVSDKYVFQSKFAFDERDPLDHDSRKGRTEEGGRLNSATPNDGMSNSEMSERYPHPRVVRFSSVSKTTPSKKHASFPVASSFGRRPHTDDVGSGTAKGVDRTDILDPRMLSDMYVDRLREEFSHFKTTFKLISDSYDSTLADFIVDRMGMSMMYSVIMGCLSEVSVRDCEGNSRSKSEDMAGGCDFKRLVLNSLIRGYVIWTDSGTIDTKTEKVYMYDYFREKYICFDKFVPDDGKKKNKKSRSSVYEKQTIAFEMRECVGPDLARAMHTDSGKKKAEVTDYRTLRGYLLHPTQGGADEKPRAVALFKLLGVSQESSGCVCHQTSSLKVRDVQNMIRSFDSEILKIGSERKRETTRSSVLHRDDKKYDKKNLCSLYEILLRHHEPMSFARPAITVRVFRQKGKRMSTSLQQHRRAARNNSETDAQKKKSKNSRPTPAI